MICDLSTLKGIKMTIKNLKFFDIRLDSSRIRIRNFENPDSDPDAVQNCLDPQPWKQTYSDLTTKHDAGHSEPGPPAGREGSVNLYPEKCLTVRKSPYFWYV